MTHQVASTETTDEGTVYVLSNGESVVVRADGSSRCRNIHGRNLANTGRFAQSCQAMRQAVRRFVAIEQMRQP